jgi:hypothetical protein
MAALYRLVEQLASRALTSGKRKVHLQRDEDGRIVGAGGEGDGEDQEQDDTDAAAESALLHFSSPRDAATIAAFLRTRVGMALRFRAATIRCRERTRPPDCGPDVAGGGWTGLCMRTLLLIGRPDPGQPRPRHPSVQPRKGLAITP